jgi:hypothetical protein
MGDKNNILKKTKDAVITLQGVLEGRHDRIIDETLNEYQVPLIHDGMLFTKLLKVQLHSIWGLEAFMLQFPL